jgi:ATP-dependent Zn protease
MCFPDSKTKQRRNTSWLLHEKIESLEMCQDVSNIFSEETLCNEKESSSKCFYSPSRFPSLFHSSSQTTCFNWLRNNSMRDHLPSLTLQSDVPSHIKNTRESSFYASSNFSNMASCSSSTFNSSQTCDSYHHRYSDTMPMRNKTKMSSSHNDEWNPSPTFTEFSSLEIKNLAQDSLTSPTVNVSKFNEESTDFLSLLQQTFENNSSTFFENKFNEDQLFTPSCHSTVLNVSSVFLLIILLSIFLFLYIFYEV